MVMGKKGILGDLWDEVHLICRMWELGMHSGVNRSAWLMKFR